MKIPKKYTPTLMAFIMSFIMSGVISLAFAFINIGLGWDAIISWPMRWLQAWLVALPVALVVMPQVRKLADKMTN
jgi:hypothetical protein